jgi:Tol biopolymer transport system component
MRRFVAILAVLVLAALTSVTLAKKGGGGKPGGDPPDYSVVYVPNPSGGRIWVMNADGSETKMLTTFSVNAPVTWHPDGDKLVACTADLSPAGIYTVDLTGEPTLLLAVANLAPGGPSMSNVATPTGNRLIAYVAREGSGYQNLFVCNESGGNPVSLLTSGPGRLYSRPTFHPSGDSIAVSTIAGPGQEWYVILVELGVDSEGKPVATNVTQLTGLTGTALEDVGVGGPAISNSGNTLAVSGGNASTPRSLWFVDMNDLTKITQVTTCTNTGAWDASDTLFYFSDLSDGNGRSKTRIHTIDSSGTITDLGVGGHAAKCRMP